MEKEMIKVIDENGEEKEAEIVLAFKHNDKNFVIYTFNETDSKGMIILYSSLLTKQDGKNIFDKIDKEDWDMVKKYMNKIVKEWEEQ